jgi:lysophospholipase L1-like esterase
MSSFYDVEGQKIISKTTEITNESTDEQYPSAKAVYDAISNIKITGGDVSQDVYDYINQYKHITILDGEHYVYNLNDGIYAVGIDAELFESQSVVYYSNDGTETGLIDGIIIVSSFLNKDLGNDDEFNDIAWIAIGCNNQDWQYSITSGITFKDADGYYVASIDEYQQKRDRTHTIDETLGKRNQSCYPSVKAVIDFVNDKLALTSNAIKSFKSGMVLALDDVSPIEHNITIKLNDNIPEDKNVFVYTYGKNILKTSATYNGSVVDYKSEVKTNTDGSITIHKAKGFNDVIDIKCTSVNTVLMPGVYTLSDGLKDNTLRDKISLKLFNSNLEFNTKDKGYDTKTIEVGADSQDYSFECRLICDNPDDEFDCVLYPQLEYGSVATEFEQYIENKVLKLSSENTERVIESIYPFTTIMCRSESNTTITCEYNKDANKFESGSNIDILTEIDLAEEHTNKQVYGAKALDETFVAIDELFQETQPLLVDGENIKTINGVSLLGEGNITVGGGAEIPENVETTDNKVTTIDENSTDEQYASAKATYDVVMAAMGELDEVFGNIETDLTNIKNAIGETGGGTEGEKVDITDTLTRTNGGFYNKDSGNISTNASAQYTEKIKVEVGDTYYVTGTYGYYVALITAYDENQTYLKDKSVFDLTNTHIIVDDYYEYIVPEGVAYLGFSTRYSATGDIQRGKDIEVFKEGGTEQGEKRLNNVQEMIDKSLEPVQEYIDELHESISAFNTSPSLKNKKVMFFGDSITDPRYELYVTKLIELTEMQNVGNFAISGSPLAHPTSSVSDLDGNYQTKLSVVNQVKYLLDNSETYDTPDLVIVFAGTNGIIPETLCDEAQFTVNNTTIVDVDTCDISNYSGAMRWIYEKLMALYPNSMVVFITPLQSAREGRYYSRMKQKRDSIIANCERLSVDYIDAFRLSGIYSGFETEAMENGYYVGGKYLKDGLHPNADGALKLAKCIQNHLMQNIYRF